MTYGLGEKISSNGKTGLSIFFPVWLYWAKSDNPTYLTSGVAVANFLAIAIATNAYTSAIGMNVVKSLAKMFQLFWPSTLNIATKLADGTPFLKNLRPKPGAKLS